MSSNIEYEEYSVGQEHGIRTVVYATEAEKKAVVDRAEALLKAIKEYAALPNARQLKLRNLRVKLFECGQALK